MIGSQSTRILDGICQDHLIAEKSIISTLLNPLGSNTIPFRQKHTKLREIQRSTEPLNPSKSDMPVITPMSRPSSSVILRNMSQNVHADNTTDFHSSNAYGISHLDIFLVTIHSTSPVPEVAFVGRFFT